VLHLSTQKEQRGKEQHMREGEPHLCIFFYSHPTINLGTKKMNMALTLGAGISSEPHVSPEALPRFVPAYLHFRKYNGSEELPEHHLISEPHTTIALQDGKTLCVQWRSKPGLFRISWDDEGAIPRLAKQWQKAQDVNDIKMIELRSSIGALTRNISDLEKQDQQDPLIWEKLASATKALQDKKEQQAAQCAEFQAKHTGEGWIKSEMDLALDEAVVADFILTCEGQKSKVSAMLVIKDSAIDIPTKFLGIKGAVVRCKFDPDEEDLEVSGEVFAPFLGPEGSPYLASPAPPVVQQAKRAKKNLRKKNLRKSPYSKP
jgi:hypothetical protein